MPNAASFAAMIAARSDGVVVLRRQTQVSPPLFDDAVIPAMVRALPSSGGLVDAQPQGRRSVIVALAHLVAAGWSPPVLVNDLVVTGPALSPAGVYVAGTGVALRVIDPGPRGGVGFWIVAEGV
jgi:hypothetical protein